MWTRIVLGGFDDVWVVPASFRQLNKAVRLEEPAVLGGIHRRVGGAPESLREVLRLAEDGVAIWLAFYASGGAWAARVAGGDEEQLRWRELIEASESMVVVHRVLRVRLEQHVPRNHLRVIRTRHQSPALISTLNVLCIALVNIARDESTASPNRNSKFVAQSGNTVYKTTKMAGQSRVTVLLEWLEWF